MGFEIRSAAAAVLLVLVFAAANLVEESAGATTFIVGDSLGWTIPSGGAGSYDSWASGHVFLPGDVLVFNFPTGVHDVAKVDNTSFHRCSASNPTTLVSVGPATITLNSSGDQYFICTFGQHCSLGQKLTLKVANYYSYKKETASVVVISSTPAPVATPHRSTKPVAPTTSSPPPAATPEATPIPVTTPQHQGGSRPLTHSKGLGGTIAGIIIAVLVSICVYAVVYRRRKRQKVSLLALTSESRALHASAGPRAFSDKAPDSATIGHGVSPGVTVDKSVEFSYEELAGATDDFSIAYKIGQGGFGAVYYAELRGEKAAIKKMDKQATREFLAELNVLTHVHHLNLVRLIGYCIENFLFLVYEYVENRNLSQHLRGTEREPLSWSARVQIAVDSAMGLEYIHEHTVPVYIHRNIKSANILIDGNYHGKVAGFGLTKLTEVGSASMATRLVGTFGYMAPEYSQYGNVSPKVDVYAFGVVLYELISAKEAVVKGNSVTEFKGLVGLFEEGLSLRKMIDPRLEDNYPLDSVRKMAQLAKACTHENPKLRPSMRSIVVALTTLSSSTQGWDRCWLFLWKPRFYWPNVRKVEL